MNSCNMLMRQNVHKVYIFLKAQRWYNPSCQLKCKKKKKPGSLYQSVSLKHNTMGPNPAPFLPIPWNASSKWAPRFRWRHFRSHLLHAPSLQDSNTLPKNCRREDTREKRYFTSQKEVSCKLWGDLSGKWIYPVKREVMKISLLRFTG